MYVQKAIYLLPILIISISFICAVVLAIVFCLKKKAKYLFIVASAFIIVSVLSCIAIKFTPPAKAPENEPAVLNRLTPENLRSVRPGCGLHTKYYEELLGKKIAKDAALGTPMSWDLVDFSEE